MPYVIRPRKRYLLDKNSCYTFITRINTNGAYDNITLDGAQRVAAIGFRVGPKPKRLAKLLNRIHPIKT